MSTDYYLLCKTCKVQTDIVASGSIAYGDKLWRGEKELDALRDFLFAHESHELAFVSEHSPLLESEDEP